jgi:type IV pilus assembly protein PilW
MSQAMKTTPNCSAPDRRGQGGFTIVELMVGMLVALVATVVMFQVFAVSEGQKRTTTGSGDAQQNGVFSLFQLERDARMAGYGLNYMSLLGCQLNGWYTPAPGSAITLSLLPVSVTQTAGAPDQVTFMYSGTDLFTAPVKLVQTMPSNTSYFKVDNRYGFNAGDLVVAGQAGQPCTLAQVSNLPTTPGSTDQILHDNTNYIDANGTPQPTQYNKSGGLAAPNNIAYSAWNPATSTGGRLYNLGQSPVAVTYLVQNNQLMVRNLLTPGQPDVAISDGIVQMQVQFAYDGNNDGRISSTAPWASNIVLGVNDQWGDAMPVGSTAADWAKVIAIRLAVVSRSMQPERPDPATGICTATTVMPVWNTPVPPITMDISANPDWRCFRYRVFEVTVPLRNMIWFAQPA